MTALLAFLAAAAIPLRNPFWPVDYAGEREVISAEARFAAKAVSEQALLNSALTNLTSTALAEAAAAAAADAAADAAQGSLENRRWIAARKSLKIGGRIRHATDDTRQAITINGKVYANGDRISITHDGRRFTWRVRNLSENNTLVLERIKWKEVTP